MTLDGGQQKFIFLFLSSFFSICSVTHLRLHKHFLWSCGVHFKSPQSGAIERGAVGGRGATSGKVTLRSRQSRLRNSHYQQK